MASLYKRAGSPYWWIQHNDGTGKQSTKFRHDLAAETRKAKAMKAEWDLRETTDAPAKYHKWEWVMPWLSGRYSHSPNTASRMIGTWKTWLVFLSENKIFGPRNVTREHAMQYLQWRKSKGHMNGRTRPGRPICHNSALLEIKTLSTVMKEAVTRGYVSFNPLYRLGLGKEPVKIKAACTDEHIAIIRAAIAERKASAKTENQRIVADALDASFEIAIRQGIRLHETHRPLSAFDIVNGTIELIAKGRKTETRALNPDLIPLIKKWQAEGRHETFKRPTNLGLAWWKFMNELRAKHPDMKRVSFHSTRVTVVTRLHDAGVPEAMCMELVGHASKTVHHVYVRSDPVKTRDSWNRMKLPPALAQMPSNGEQSSPGNPDSLPAIGSSLPS
jgi:site-specific recombinase XerD